MSVANSQQTDRLSLAPPDRLDLRASSPIEGQSMDLPQQRNPLVPGDPPGQTRIVGSAALIRIEDAALERREVRQLTRLAQGEPPQLRQQIPEVQGWIAPRAVVEVEHDDGARIPQELGRAQVAVQERRRRRRRRGGALQL